MTVKTVSSAAAYIEANTPPASINAAGTVFKSFIYKGVRTTKKETITVSETFLRINDKASLER
ncbi:hypothetical protein D3C72_2013290 [compost metagenome]